MNEQKGLLKVNAMADLEFEPTFKVAKLLLAILGAVCGPVITAEATTGPCCPCKATRKSQAVCLSQVGLSPLHDLLFAASAVEAQGHSLTDLIADIIGHPSLGPVQLLP